MSYSAARSSPELTPLKELALRQMARHHLTKALDGWHPGVTVSQDGTKLPLNSHTITWLKDAGYAAIENGLTAKITRKGREVLDATEFQTRHSDNPC